MLVATALATSASAPRLRLVAMQPLTVRGIDFKPAERVRVRLLLEERTLARSVTATQVGTFMVTFPDVRVDRCTTFTVKSRGNQGSRAVLTGRPLPECPEPVTP